MEVIVADKKVVFKKSILVRDGWNYFDLMAKASMSDLRTVIPLACIMIESWEFEGSPSEEESYLKMDVLREAMPLFTKLMRYVNQLYSGFADEDTDDEENKDGTSKKN